jgi:hypothetical protein
MLTSRPPKLLLYDVTHILMAFQSEKYTFEAFVGQGLQRSGLKPSATEVEKWRSLICFFSVALRPDSGS